MLDVMAPIMGCVDTDGDSAHANQEISQERAVIWTHSRHPINGSAAASTTQAKPCALAENDYIQYKTRLPQCEAFAFIA